MTGERPHLLQLRPLLVEGAHLHRELRLGLRQLGLLGRDDLDDPVIHLDGSNPLAKTLAGHRRLADTLGVELAVVDVPVRTCVQTSYNGYDKAL